MHVCECTRVVFFCSFYINIIQLFKCEKSNCSPVWRMWMIYVECHRDDVVRKRNVYEFRGTHANELNLLRVIYRCIRYLVLTKGFVPSVFPLIFNTNIIQPIGEWMIKLEREKVAREKRWYKYLKTIFFCIFQLSRFDINN